MNRGFRTPKFRVYRTALYTSLGMTWVIFVGHGVLRYGWQTFDSRMSLRWIATVALANLVGAVVFALRVRHKFPLCLKSGLLTPRE